VKEGTYIQVLVNGRTTFLRGWVETDSNSVDFGKKLFRDQVSHGQVVELAGMTVTGTAPVVSYTDSQGTKSLGLGESFYPEPGGRFTVTYA
jgi:hypothetical protein